MNKKFLLVALNAKYIHTNPAVHSLRTFSGVYKDNIELIEFTINNHLDDIIIDIYKKQADFIGFSCYIWNIDMITKIVPELRKLMPKVKIWFGGPEVSYDVRDCLNTHKGLDGIVIGEGEQTFLELVKYYLGDLDSLGQIDGIAYKKSALLYNEDWDYDKNKIQVTGQRQGLDLNDIPFMYDDLDQFDNKIIYYESSKGCPFSCTYCLSSVDRRIRLRDVELVKRELKVFLDHEIPQVKFIDRTFNCNKDHAMEIWKFIKDNDNGISNFHFEISADLLTEEELELLGELRPGQVQFEIGIQSTNSKTIKAIQRQMDLDKLASNVERIREKRNIHQHLDLIAGLPYEDYDSFKKSFNDVYAMRPDQLQLGFLKVLKGSPIEEDSEKYGIVYQDAPPYEVLFTNWISYDEIIKLKGITEMVEVYHNSDQFNYSIRFLEHEFESPFHMYEALDDYYKDKGLDKVNHSRNRRFDILLDFYKERCQGKDLKTFGEILYLDLCLRDNVKALPDYAPEQLEYRHLRKACESHEVNHRFAKVEKFSSDIRASAEEGKAVGEAQYIIFDYTTRDPLSNSAKLIVAEEADVI